LPGCNNEARVDVSLQIKGKGKSPADFLGDKKGVVRGSVQVRRGYGGKSEIEASRPLTQRAPDWGGKNHHGWEE